MLGTENALRVDNIGRYLPGTWIEVLNSAVERGRYRAALFDFDGTLSLIREGWQGVMIPMMVDLLAAAPRAEPRDQLTRIVEEYVTRLTGTQTIYQMIELAGQIAKRGGSPLPPLEYKRRYQDLLLERIQHRREGLRSGRIRPVEMLVPGTIEILAALRDRGLELYCASGTDQAYMHEEAELLGLREYLGDHLYGALDDYRRFSKAALIEWIIEEHGLRGAELLSFGDGFVEIQNTKEAGGTAVGVASDEISRQGIDDWKRSRLAGVGADIIIPDYREWEPLLRYLFMEEDA